MQPPPFTTSGVDHFLVRTAGATGQVRHADDLVWVAEDKQTTLTHARS
jgi:hypothetical protein